MQIFNVLENGSILPVAYNGCLMTCIPFWCSASQGSFLGAVITPNHILSCAHTLKKFPSLGDIRFVGENGEEYWANSGYGKHIAADAAIYTLSETLPSFIKPAILLEKPLKRGVSNKGFFVNRNKDVSECVVKNAGQVAVNFLPDKKGGKYIIPRVMDSGSPVFVWDKSTPKLVSALYYGEYGPAYYGFKDLILKATDGNAVFQ